MNRSQRLQCIFNEHTEAVFQRVRATIISNIGVGESAVPCYAMRHAELFQVITNSLTYHLIVLNTSERKVMGSISQKFMSTGMHVYSTEHISVPLQLLRSVHWIA
jgi:hypothetical protein